jgi:two-component system, OmpR family, response regulator
MRILLVEDNEELAHQLRRRMKQSGFAVDRFGTIQDATAALTAYAYEITILDRRLPDGDGLSIIPEIRRRQPGGRVLLLTALDSVDERVTGLDAGADDYLTKPFDLDELMARIRASLRRPGGDAAPPVTIGALTFEPSSRTVTVAGKPAIFHHRELSLLEALIRRAGRIVERETLLADIWGCDEIVQPHALTIIVSRLRARLDRLGAGIEINMVRGIGYFIAEQER